MTDRTAQTPVHPTRRVAWRAAALIVLLGVVQFFGTFAFRRPLTWRTEMVITISWWTAWLPLVPIVDAVARRFAFTQGRKIEAVIAHATTAALLSLIHLAVIASVTWVIDGPGGPNVTAFSVFARFLGVPFFVFDVATYSGVAAALVAARLARAYHDEELRAARLEARATALEASVVQAKLDALQLQLKPHFLFNALNAVSGLVGRGNTEDAQEMLGRLGAILRQTMSTEHAHFTSVEDELAQVQDFLFIEQVRFGDRLKVAVSAGDAVRGCAIPSMLLQPLVENAVRHGIESTVAGGTVSIDVARLGDELSITIEDTGRGFSLVNGRVLRDGVGLTNTRARLEQLFGAEWSLAIGNRAEGGGRVVVRIPWMPQSEEGEPGVNAVLAGSASRG